MSGSAHLPYLIVSLKSLRRHWSGNVIVRAWPESYDLVKSSVSQFDDTIEVVLRDPEYRGKNAQFIDKIRVAMNDTSDEVLYLDADTMVMRNPSIVFDQLAIGSGYVWGFAPTQFNDWTSNIGMPSKRVKGLVGRCGIDQGGVRAALEQPFPSPNGGIWAARPGSPILAAWFKQTLNVKDLFIADETVLHIIVSGFKMDCLENWNCSPKYSRCPDEDVGIWHFHGDSNVRPNKSQKGYDLWMPEFIKCLRDDVGGMKSWIGEVGNRYINDLIYKGVIHV